MRARGGMDIGKGVPFPELEASGKAPASTSLGAMAWGRCSHKTNSSFIGEEKKEEGGENNTTEN